MTEAEAVEAILQHWETAWEALHPADEEDPDHVPWFADNERKEAAASWVRITVVPTISNQATMGSEGARRWARRGQIGVQIFVRPDAGPGPMASLADDVRACLEGVRISTPGVDEPVCTYAGSTGSTSTNGAWSMTVVTVPFRYDQHR
jgi:hypothetical protein